MIFINSLMLTFFVSKDDLLSSNAMTLEYMIIDMIVIIVSIIIIIVIIIIIIIIIIYSISYS